MQQQRNFFYEVMLCGLAALFFASSASAQPEAGGQARIECPVKSFNFGKIIAGAQVEHEFLLRNGGEGELVVQRIVPACGCTTVALPEPIAPGQEGVLRVAFDSSGFSGAVSKVVRVFSNDATQPHLDLVLEGEVLAGVLVSPPWIRFNEVVRGQSAGRLQDVRLEVPPGSPISLGRAKVFSPHLSVVEVSGSDKVKHLQVKLGAEVPLGELRDRITVQLIGAETSRTALNVPVFVSVVDSLILEPRVVSFGVVQGEALLVRVAKLRSLTSESVKIEKFRIDRPGIEVKIKPEDEGRSHLIQLTLDPRLVETSMAATLEIFTDRKDLERLTLQVHVVVPYRP
ncbi:MAG: DUF1573 domain-containing protein [Deltaproteobacteria bacterium]|nr:DUF1573 domain-containing protein [Deltaproteobacteria bacterium]